MNNALTQRLQGIHAGLMAAYAAGVESTSASKGVEREIFVRRFLSEVLAPAFRLGHGEIIDTRNHRSGQIDIVIENPFFPSLPVVEGGPRLYLAEGVAAALEIKSDVRSEWHEVLGTVNQLKDLVPCPGAVTVNSPLGMADCRVPFFAVGFRGWKRLAAVRRALEKEKAAIDGVFVIEGGLFCVDKKYQEYYNAEDVEGDSLTALWTFLCCVHHRIMSIQSISALPRIYLG